MERRCVSVPSVESDGVAAKVQKLLLPASQQLNVIQYLLALSIVVAGGKQLKNTLQNWLQNQEIMMIEEIQRTSNVIGENGSQSKFGSAT